MLTGASLVAARRAGLKPVLWTSSGRDWFRSSTPDSVLRSARTGLGPGATILLHDRGPAWRASLAALPTLVAACTERGLRVGPLAEHGLL
jgi:peptidoglycan/xylan/chitin deacetylase (PgdA/CDA1 family)